MPTALRRGPVGGMGDELRTDEELVHSLLIDGPLLGSDSRLEAGIERLEVDARGQGVLGHLLGGWSGYGDGLGREDGSG